MTEIILPSGVAVDFGEASQVEIEDALEAMREQDSSLFEEPQAQTQAEPQTIDELVQARSGTSGADSTDGEPDFSPTNLGQITNKMDEVEDLEERGTCITDHPGFAAVCLNVWVLQTAYHPYLQRHHAMDGSQIEYKTLIKI